MKRILCSFCNKQIDGQCIQFGDFYFHYEKDWDCFNDYLVFMADFETKSLMAKKPNGDKNPVSTGYPVQSVNVRLML